MALITAGGLLTTVRRNGVTRNLRAADFPAGPTDAALEATVQSALGSALNCAAFIHIFSRSPVSFAIRLAPLGHVPAAIWWNVSVP